MARESPPSVEAVEEGLKDFQRVTVDFVFNRLYCDPDPTRRFLIADEVGLGKTLVARGVIARTIRHLWDTTPQIDVVYICSNQDIARQNVNRLSVGDDTEFVRTSRITLLPMQVSGLRENKLNFISFTPGTSFRLRSSMGRKKERVVLYWLLKEAWDLKGAAPLNVFQGRVKDRIRFREYARRFSRRHSIDKKLQERFLAELDRKAEQARAEGRPDLRSRFEELCDLFHRARKRENVPVEQRRKQRRVIGDLRTVLAATCVEALEPDLIILDEFQRFKDLLTGDDPAAELARELFEFTDAVTELDVRVLLLSATPYKMYTILEESGENEHYKDFLETLRFLYSDDGRAEEVAELFRNYRRELYRLSDGRKDRLREVKRGLEERLRTVMVRSERLGASSDRSGMLREMPVDGATLEPFDVVGYLNLQRVARSLKHRDTMRYWKSAPYLLSFMEGYKLKGSLRRALESPGDPASSEESLGVKEELAELVSHRSGLFLPWREIEAYKEVDPGNARLRALLDEPIGRDGWRLLWIPPALSYYEPGGPFAHEELRGLTKRLVFSAWRVVPRVIGTLLSYEAERRIFHSFEESPENTRAARQVRRGLLRFALARGRLVGMPVLALLYPSLVLAKLCDPLAIARKLRAGNGGEGVGGDEVLREAEARLTAALSEVSDLGNSSRQEDEAWYWAAPILLDRERRPAPTQEWFGRRGLAGKWAGKGAANDGADDEEAAGRWSDHVKRAKALLAGEVELGSPPSDLPEVLAYQGLAGPAVCALRALGRLGCSGITVADPEVRDQAAQTAWEFRHLFNLPESMAIIRGLDEREPYWRRTLEYSFEGNLQAVLDEFVHFLRESLGYVGECDRKAVGEVAEAIREALSLRSVSLAVDEARVSRSGREVTLRQRRLRTHYALSFGDESGSEEEAGARAGQVRTAFNSPFWPFVLATTSVGQEGLDFHAYCHAVVHWNLPSNPVDLEQREGRVHRYKGHAIRRNVAVRHGPEVLDADSSRAPADAPGSSEARAPEPSGARDPDSSWIAGPASSAAGPPDPWEELFEAAERERHPDRSELVPFWLYEIEDGAQIERHVPALPLTRERIRIRMLRRSLAVYRMAFGQPRQEDLVEFLLEHMDEDQIHSMLEELRIDLSPPAVTAG